MAGLLNITIGSTTYGFELSGDPIHTVEKSLAGEIQRQTGNLRRGDQIDAPRSRSSITGIGVSRVVDVVANAASRAWEMKNIDAWPGMWCLGPNARTPTADLSGTRQVLGFAEGIAKVFYFAEHATAENIAYFVGSTTTWTDATATLDFNAGNSNGFDGFPCRAMWEHNDGGTAKMYALRKFNEYASTPQQHYQLMSSTNGTTWTVLNHGFTGVDSPSNDDANGQPNSEGTIPVIGGIDIDGTSYTLRYSGTTVQLRQATGTLATWSNSTGGSFTSSAAPISLLAWANAAGTVQPFAFTREGIYRYSGSAWVRETRWGYVDTNNGLFPTVWQPSSLDTDFLIVSNGPNLFAFWWDSNSRLQSKNISPIFRTQGLPTYRQGRILALATSGQFLWAFIGGEDADHTGGWYKNAYPSADTWIGPVYAAAAANRIARAAIFSSADDNTGRLHIAMDNGTASDTDQLFFLDIDRDPRTVTSYQHTAATGSLVLPKDDLDLPEVLTVFRKVEGTGTSFSASNKIDDVFVSNDAAPIAADGSWGTTLGEITASGGSVNYAGTPAGTGLSARASQVRVDLIGASNASPYVETLNVYGKKMPTIKDIWVFPIDLQKSAFEGNGSVPQRTLETVMSDLEAVRDAATDLSVTVGSRLSSVVMEPYRLGGTPAIEYDTKIVPFGSDSGQDRPKQALLRLVEV